MNDEHILQLIRSGKTEKAFLALYKEFPKVKALIRKSGGSSTDAADIFQEGLIILHRKLTHDPESIQTSLSAYLYGTCRYIWYKTSKSSLPSAGLQEISTDEADMETWLQEDQKVKLAEKVLELIGEKCRDILIGFYTLNMSMEALAKKFGFASVNTAKTRKYKCLEFARNKFGEMYQKP